VSGWQKPVKPPTRPSWEAELRRLYVRSIDMEAQEFEALLEVAMTGQRPNHPGLPAYLPFMTETVLC
jgi:hypothetical protein